MPDIMQKFNTFKKKTFDRPNVQAVTKPFVQITPPRIPILTASGKFEAFVRKPRTT